MKSQTQEYLEALKEAAELIKLRKEIPEYLIEKAIGRYPSCPSCAADMDSFVEPYCRLPQYLEEFQAFKAAATQLASN